jgi:tellurium resistance protein TerD
MASLQKGAEVEVVCSEGDDLLFGLSWEFVANSSPVDLDAQAVMFDMMGVLVDAAYYNQLQACGGAVNHSGDSKDGAGEGYDESIRFDLNALPGSVHYIVLLVSVHTEGQTFSAVESAGVDVQELSSGKKLCSFSVGCHGNNTSIALCSVRRQKQSDGTSKWLLKNVSKTMEGRNFNDCKAAIRKEVIDSQIEPGLVGESVLSMDKTFNMRKDDVATIPSDLKNLFLGLGWTCEESLDLDSSVILVERNLKINSIVSFSNLSESGVKHAGDNTTGDGDGDDEKIFFDLQKVKPEVQHLVFVVNIYSDACFADVSDSYVRLVSGEHELARYKLNASLESRGLIFCRLTRKEDSWVLHCIGRECRGHTANTHECKGDVIRTLRTFHDISAAAGYEEEAQPQPQSGGCDIQ